MTGIAAADMFMVATVTFKLLYAVIVLNHRRRRVIHFEVTQNPSQAWLARQIIEAFPWDTAPRYLLGDRDTSYGICFHRSRTHLSLNKDCPNPRSIQPPSAGKLVAFPEVGGLHHRYERCAA